MSHENIIQCQKCKSLYFYKPEYEGKKVRCFVCKNVWNVVDNDSESSFTQASVGAQLAQKTYDAYQNNSAQPEILKKQKKGVFKKFLKFALVFAIFSNSSNESFPIYFYPNLGNLSA
jgi:hypothetical protein